MNNAQLIRNLELNLKRARVADLQRNPNLSTDSEVPLKQRTEEYNFINRAGAYIFGDTYEGMPIDEAIQIILKEGFTSTSRLPNGVMRFKHEHLGIGLTPRCTEDGRLTMIMLDLALSVYPEKVNDVTCCGLGLIDMDLVCSTFYGQLDATGGFSVKMYILRCMSRDFINEESYH